MQSFYKHKPLVKSKLQNYLNFLFNPLMDNKDTGPVRLPKVLFNSWAALVDKYFEAHPNDKPIAPVIPLQRLISLGNAPWNKQVACIKESGSSG